MASCEKCWWDSSFMATQGLGDRVEIYSRIVKERKCTPEEQAGEFWDEENKRDRRFYVLPTKGDG